MKAVTDSWKCFHLSPDGLRVQGYTRVCYATTPLKSIKVSYKWRDGTLLLAFVTASAPAPAHFSTDGEAAELQGGRTQPGRLSASHWHLAVVDSLNILTSPPQ